MKLLKRAGETLILAVVAGVGAVVCAVVVIAWQLLRLAVLAVLGVAVVWGVLTGLYYAAYHTHGSGVAALWCLAIVVGFVALCGAAGAVSGVVGTERETRRQKRQLDRIGGLRLERDEPFNAS